MKWVNIKLFIKHLWINTIALRIFYILYLVFMLLVAYSTINGIKNITNQNTIRLTHQEEARASWEANPDKHPHRMAHFGTFAFRSSSILAIFDYGIESYTGNGIFLEAHRQNSVNFSEATFSSGTLRFGELSLALLLQFVLPLILFFIGFSSVAFDKQNSTLKILLLQGATWKEILFGKTIGLFIVALTFFLPILLIVIISLLVIDNLFIDHFLWLRLLIICIGYLCFFFIVSAITIIVSAKSNSGKNALLKLLAVWLFFVVLVPKTVQALGNYLHPTPTKLAFQSMIEEDVIKTGDSHNPDDLHYKHLRDSVLAVHKVEEVTDLPFNYSGFVMREGEKISSRLYRKHYKDLVGIYNSQNRVSEVSSLINPFTAIKHLSMTISGTDFYSYLDFQKQADNYRYNLAQTMNELQMKYISPKKKSGSEGKTHVVKHEHWEEFPDFHHQPTVLKSSIKNSIWALLSVSLWSLLAYVLLLIASKNTKAL